MSHLDSAVSKSLLCRQMSCKKTPPSICRSGYLGGGVLTSSYPVIAFRSMWMIPALDPPGARAQVPRICATGRGIVLWRDSAKKEDFREMEHRRAPRVAEPAGSVGEGSRCPTGFSPNPVCKQHPPGTSGLLRLPTLRPAPVVAHHFPVTGSSETP